jgi:hypothetical protein
LEKSPILFLMNDFWFYFNEGLFHVLDWNAYDHILFLVALTVPYGLNSWKKLLYLVSIFTVGHTIALALSVYEVVKVSSTLIELLIPITILITALYNIITAGKTKRMEKMGIYAITTLFFGCIHGFGFSTYFKMMTAGSDSKLIPLIEYTLGIEGAQLIIVLAVLALSFVGQSIFRFSRRDWILVTSAIVVGVVIPILRANL